MSARYRAAPIEPTDGAGLAALFHRSDSVCFCRFWHFEGNNKAWEARCAFERDVSERELLRAVDARSSEAQGIVAHDIETGHIVGWCKLAPRASLTKLTARPPYRELDGDATRIGSIGCMLVDPAHRRSGVARAMTRAAIELGARLGWTAIEAYPRVSPDAMLHDAERWNGPIEVYRELGFVEVRGDSPYPVLRRTIA
jgi:GNAT superfamily N-acetyltransferase